MDKVNLTKLFSEAFTVFLNKEKDNIVNGVAERNLCARLAQYIENLLPDYKLSNYVADSEYNRKQNGEIKTILDEKLQIIPIQCDIIVHSRGHHIKNDNLIAIEMKKAYQSKTDKDNDRKRLRALTKDSYDDMWSSDGKTHPEHVCGYALGVYIEIDPDQKKCLLEFYKKSQKQSEEIINF